MRKPPWLPHLRLYVYSGKLFLGETGEGGPYLGIEMERKYLVHRNCLPELVGGERIIQGYLCATPQIRFRLWAGKLIITIKQLRPDGSRFELETEKVTPSNEETITLMGLALYPPIEKVRYRIPHKGLTWEVDVYQGDNEGLITVDVEMPSLDWVLEFPVWVDSDREITNDPRYFNLNLGRNQFRSWV